MKIARVKRFMLLAEEFLEDFIIILLSIVIIILSLSALSVLAVEMPTEVSERAQAIAELLPRLNFLAKAEYFAALLFPWVAMLIGLLVFRELWLLRRAIERIEFRKLLESMEKRKRKR